MRISIMLAAEAVKVVLFASSTSISLHSWADKEFDIDPGKNRRTTLDQHQSRLPHHHNRRLLRHNTQIHHPHLHSHLHPPPHHHRSTITAAVAIWRISS